MIVNSDNSRADYKEEWPWPHFSKGELSCRHCGEYYHWPEFLDKLEGLRALVGRPLYISSAHRCSLHNARVGGAPLSQHLTLAVDIITEGHDRQSLLSYARQVGFTGFGFYTSFLHLDLGRPRQWFGSERAAELWQIF